jgi:hypothetical protein
LIGNVNEPCHSGSLDFGFVLKSIQMGIFSTIVESPFLFFHNFFVTFRVFSFFLSFYIEISFGLPI